MPVLPFHKYIGPGNPIDSGEPVDEDDRIAKIHDIKYENAKTEEDVRKADVEAICNFRRSWKEGGNWHSLIGDLGLSIKYFIESYTGVIYPRLNPDDLRLIARCRTVYVTNILKLHCVFRERLYDRYSTMFWDPYLAFSNNTVGFVQPYKEEFLNEIPEYIYVPIEWLDLFKKIRGLPNPKPIRVFHSNFHIKKCENCDLNCDIFNLRFWFYLFNKLCQSRKKKPAKCEGEIFDYTISILT